MSIVLDLYCRISKDQDGTLRACEAQEAQGRAWVAEHADEGYEVGKVHYDHALSAWSPLVDRPSWNDLMARLERREADGVWVRDLDRFTRKIKEAVRLVELAEAGVRVVAGYSAYDLNGYSGQRRFYDDAVDAAMESKRISERTIRGKANRALARGKSNAVNRGFARDGFLPNPADWLPGDPRIEVPAAQLARERAAVRGAAEALLAGGTLNSIARGWNEEGLLSVRGSQWNGADIRQMLESPAIAGHISYRGEIVGQEAGEPVLDPALWDRLMLHFASRKLGRPPSTYLLSGILRCSLCGAAVYGKPVKTMARYQDGSVRRIYHCQVRGKYGGCGKQGIDQRHADAEVALMAIERMGDPRHAATMARKAERRTKHQQSIEAEISVLNAEADSLASKTGQPGWTVARVNAAMGNFDERIREAKARLKALGEIPSPGAVAADARAEWEAADLPIRRAMIKRAFPEGLMLEPATCRGSQSLLEERIKVGRPVL